MKIIRAGFLASGILFNILFSVTSKSETIINDSLVSGTWTKAGSPYLVKRNIYLSEDSTLTIEPGVKVEFTGFYKLDIRGRILAIGSTTDSIIFSAKDTAGFYKTSVSGAWAGLFCHLKTKQPSDSSKFKYCIFRNAKSTGYGAALFLGDKNILVSNCLFTENYCYNGGAAIMCENDAVIVHNIFRNNVVHEPSYSNGYGGALYASTCKPVIAYNIFEKNSADCGGAVCLSTEGGAYFQNNIFIKNHSSSWGSAIAVYGIEKIVNCTFYSNSGGNLLVFLNNAKAGIYNSIFWNNKNTYRYNVYNSTNCYSEFYNCIIDTSSVAGSSFIRCLDKDPYFVDAENGNFQLTDSSYCVNKGTKDTTSLNLLPFDFKGNTRIYYGTIDVGAYEFTGTTVNRLPILISKNVEYVKTSDSTKLAVDFDELDIADENKITIVSLNSELKIKHLIGDTSGSTCWLVPDYGFTGEAKIVVSITDNRNIISDINSDTITIRVGDLWGEINTDSTLAKGIINVVDNVVIPKGKTLKIQPGTILNFLGNYSITVNGKIIAQGNVNDSIIFTVPFNRINKGWDGIYCNSNTDTSIFKYCVFKYAKTTGKGCYTFENTKAIISNCLFMRNTCYSTEMNYAIGVTNCNTSTVDIVNNFFTENQALESSYYAAGGGAIFIDYGNVTINNNVFFKNKAESSGGAIHAYEGNLKICNNTFYKNHANDYGGAIDIMQGTPVLMNNIFWENSAASFKQIYLNYTNAVIKNCVVQDGIEGIYGNPVYENNQDFYPNFIDTTKINLGLANSSFCIDAGYTDTSGLGISKIDFYGKARISNGRIDIGASEYQGTPVNRLPFLTKRTTEYIKTSDSLKLSVDFNEYDKGDINDIDIRALNPKLKIQFSGGNTSGTNYIMVPDKGWAGKTFVIITVLDASNKISAINCDTFTVYAGDLWGEIKADSMLKKGIVNVCSNITISNGATLNIPSGTTLNFLDKFGFDVKGRILAKGYKTDSIKFTVADSMRNTGWNGILFDNTLLTNDTSKFEYCLFEFAQSFEKSAVFSFYSYSKVIINHCYFFKNKSISKYNSDFGTAITCFGSSPLIINNYFKENENFSYPGYPYRNDGGAIYVSYGKPLIANNVFYKNSAGAGGAIYLTNSAAKIYNNTFFRNYALIGGAIEVYNNSNCVLANNIFWENVSLYYDKKYQLHIWEGSNVSIFNSIFPNGEFIDGVVTNSSNNMIKYPCFADSANGNFALTDSSYCINAGLKDSVVMNLPFGDILSNSRIREGRIDIGAYEFQGTSSNRLPVLVKRSPEHTFISDSLKLSLQFQEFDSSDKNSVVIKSLNPSVKVNYHGGDTSGSSFTLIPQKNWIGKALIAVSVLDKSNKISSFNTDTFYFSTGDLWGNITKDSTLEKDTVYVCGDVNISGGITLRILPGTVLNFTGHYKMDVKGSILASGTRTDSIKFTVPDSLRNIGWNGINLNASQITNDSSEFEYCTFEFASSIDQGAVFNLCSSNTKLLINHCSFFDNVAYTNSVSTLGGVIVCLSSNPIITNNLFENNIIKRYPSYSYYGTGGVIYISNNANPVIANNIFSANSSELYGGTIYIDNGSCKIISNTFYQDSLTYALYISYNTTCTLKNNIFWNKSSKQIYIDSNGNANVENCVVKDGISGVYGSANSFLNNIQEYPNFRDIISYDLSLTDSSICLNNGTIDTTGLCLPKDDFLGNPRIFDGAIDIGAIEYTKKVKHGLNPFGGKGRSGSVSFVFNNKVYIGLGEDKNGVMNDFWRYNQAKDTWSQIDSLPGPARAEAVSFTIKEKAYVGLGRSNYPYSYYKDFYEFDPATEKWKRIEDFSGSARYNAVSFTIADTAYVGTGLDTTDYKNDFWKFNPLSKWTRIADLNKKRSGASAFSFNNKGYVTGGTFFDSYSVQLSDMQEYDPLTNSWNERIFADGMNLSVSDAFAIALGDKAFICYGNKDAVISYNPRTNDVQNLGDVLGIGRYRFNPVNFIINDSVYFGLGDSGIFNTVYKNDILKMNLPVYFNPTDLLLSKDSVGENSTIGSVIGTFNTIDRNIADTFEYNLVPGDGDSYNQSFSISENKLLINCETNYENQASYSIRVRTTDPEGLNFEKKFIIKITDKNDAPSDIYLSNNFINENSSDQTVLGTLSSADEDPDESFTYSMVGGEGSDDNLYFHVNNNELITDSFLNYENKPQLLIRIRSTDQEGLSIEKRMLINVADINEEPWSLILSNNTVDINALPGTLVGVFKTFDPDKEDTSFTYSFVTEDVSSDNKSFRISRDSLYVLATLRSGYYQFLVKTTDSKGLSIIKKITIKAESSDNIDLNNFVTTFSSYPNPANDYFSVVPRNDKPVDAIFLTSILGEKIIPEYRISGNVYTINTMYLKPGIYNLIIIQKNDLYTGKLIKK